MHTTLLICPCPAAGLRQHGAIKIGTGPLHTTAAALMQGFMATDRPAVPLQGFVSNKDSEREDGKGDPLETLLYAVLVASSARASVAELATILQARLLGASGQAV